MPTSKETIFVNARSRFPVVGVGASAGGVQALEGFFQGVPPQPGLSFVIVTHLSRSHDSILPEIIARFTSLPVHSAADGMVVEINSVYVLPPCAVLTVDEGKLQMRDLLPSERERKPIDVFFSSLAADLGELSAGVVLSGGDSDGTLGVKAIKERGGLALAQTADDFGPNIPEMPESAMTLGVVDFCVPAPMMGQKLLEFAHSAAMNGNLAADSEEALELARLDSARSSIYGILRSQIGHDFSGYKTKTFIRRVQRRMQVNQITKADVYVDLLVKSSEEVAALFRDLLINVTNFFRDKEAFDTLAERVIPALFVGREAEDTIRVWVPGCATGEEVFSIGILLREHMEQLPIHPRVQIFATDIDERALGVARAARYPAQLLESVSAERRERFFTKDSGSYVVTKEVRDLCVFSPHSVIRDPPFSRMDLVSCRNLLIYFGGDVQNQVIPTFHYALRPEGFLFLGMSENVSQFDDLFKPIEKKHRIFRRRPEAASPLRLPLIVASIRPGQDNMLKPRRPQIGGAALREMVENRVLETFSPPHVLVNRDGDIVYYSTRTGKYLEAASGVPTRQILTMARKGLRLDMRTVFREAVESGRLVTREGILLEDDDGRVQIIRLTVEPLRGDQGSEPLFLVLFVDEGPSLSREEAQLRASTTHDGTTYQIEQELRETRERLQSMIEEYETAVEELKSSNEELVSVNEELQSTNEELEASKEELVSLNEELHTVNSELNGKLEALDRANSTAVATVFLDKRLVIRSFTPAMNDVFNILPTDRGRPITDLSSRLELPSLAEDIASVVANHKTIERRVRRSDQSAHYLVRFSPYRNGDRRIEGAVISFVNVTGMTLAEERQQVLIAELQHRTRNLLAVVQSIAHQTLESTPSVDGFNKRLGALGRSQTLLSSASDDQVDLAEIMRVELATFAGDKMDKVSLSGPPVSLSLDYVQALALAIHELSTNALKFGALKEASGRLAVQWQVDHDAEGKPTLILEWHESNLSVVPDTSHRGYGRQLIEQALVFSLRAKTELRFEQDGLVCRIEVPLPDMQDGLVPRLEV
jgi:two-component system CheB/CheR fusion protein